MREIKFRAQNFGGYWRYSDKCKNGLTEFFSYFTSMEGNDSPILNQNTLSQYIELKDRTGKEIYEGDVVQNIEKEKGFYGKIKAVDMHTGCNWEITQWTIIGNIHENPELIK